MSIDSLSAKSMATLYHQRRLDMKTLSSAVQAGDVTAAQAALQSFQKDVQAISDAGGGTGSKTGSPFGVKISTDLSNLATAVQAGNMTDAQSALSTYRSDLRAGRHQGSANGGQSAFSTDLTNFLSAAQSGDSSQVQSAAAALTKDLEGLFQAHGTRGPSGDHDGDHDGQAAANAASASAPAASTVSSTSDPITGDLVNIAAALKSNDATALQTANAALNKDLQSFAAANGGSAQGIGGHHHHHHHHGGGTSQSGAVMPVQTTPVAVPATPAPVVATPVDPIPPATAA